ncbi:MAG: cytochrome c [Gemmatimonadota bacterium]|nr:cytochrome c [Gemmatimonadota bacterium]
MEPGRGGEARVFLWTAVALAGTYACLRLIVPWISVWLGLSPLPAPVPAFAIGIYMLCAGIGALVYVSSDEQRWHAFLAPVVRLLVLEPGPGRRLRLVTLGLVPLAVGWTVWQQVSPSAEVPTAIRLQHPTQPSEYAALRNPDPTLSGDDTRTGTVLYQKNCRPCHGAAADGTGPLARGLRLRPVDFTDVGTIASVVESYPFWRVREGNAGLPDIATPWNSAMPAWQDELSDDEIWRIVATEYLLSGTEPRKPEGARP